MKALLLLGGAVALLAGCARQSELDQAQAELAAIQEKVRLLETERVPRAELAQAEAAAATAQAKLRDVRQELAGTKAQLSDAEAQLAAAQEKVGAAERVLNTPGVKPLETAGASPTPGLVKGTYTLKDGDTIVYSHDAQLNFADGVTISSPSGLMMSDKDREIVAGNLVVETPRGAGKVTSAPAPVNAAGAKEAEDRGR